MSGVVFGADIAAGDCIRMSRGDRWHRVDAFEPYRGPLPELTGARIARCDTGLVITISPDDRWEDGYVKRALEVSR